jgi:hypothetical protein
MAGLSNISVISEVTVLSGIASDSVLPQGRALSGGVMHHPRFMLIDF